MSQYEYSVRWYDEDEDGEEDDDSDSDDEEIAKEDKPIASFRISSTSSVDDFMSNMDQPIGEMARAIKFWNEYGALLGTVFYREIGVFGTKDSVQSQIEAAIKSGSRSFVVRSPEGGKFISRSPS